MLKTTVSYNIVSRSNEALNNDARHRAHHRIDHNINHDQGGEPTRKGKAAQSQYGKALTAEHSIIVMKEEPFVFANENICIAPYFAAADDTQGRENSGWRMKGSALLPLKLPIPWPYRRKRRWADSHCPNKYKEIKKWRKELQNQERRNHWSSEKTTSRRL